MTTTSLRRPLAALLLLVLAACGGTSGTPAPIGDAWRARVPAEWNYDLNRAIPSGTHGAIASDDSIATAVGMHVLRDLHGNAVDAVVATALTLAVVYPEAGNIGGGGFAVLRAPDGTLASLDFREKAPGAASRDMYLDDEGDLSGRSLWGHQASGVPGSVAGLYELHRRFGKLAWPTLVEPAIRLASEGFVVNPRFRAIIAGRADRFRDYPGSAELLLPGGEPPVIGSVWRNPDLAQTLQRIAQDGPAGFYEGRTAKLIVDEMQRGGGLITAQDLADYRAEWRDPVTFRYRGKTVVSMPPASSGGITLALIADILSGYDMTRLGWHSVEELHVTTEAMRRAFADRNHYLGDPDYVDIPTRKLLSAEYAAAQRATIDMKRATPSSRIDPGLEGAGDGEGPETTHISVVDEYGGAVALTTTINFLYGSGVAVTGAGFFLNNEMDDFAAKPGTANGYGLIQGEANAVAAGKRPLSAMTPTIVLGVDGTPLLVTGARGGPRIITATWQVVSNVLDYDMTLPEANAAPRIHNQHFPDLVSMEEGGFTADAVQGLFRRGDTIEPTGGVGVAPAILRLPNGSWEAASDPRASTNGAAAW